MDDEEALAHAIRRGDADAWAGLYEDYFPRVYRYIAVRIKDRTEAEDLAGQVFLKAVEAGRSFTWRGAPVSSWLFRIARNQVIDYLRLRKYRQAVPLDNEVPGSGAGPDDLAAVACELARLVQAIGELTGAQRDVIELRFTAGLPTAEVARVLGKSPSAVKAMQHSALESLRRKLARPEDRS
ncbi:MAG: sigma-70 family RNA polymerase sigma factor [Dehalococcoidia bacterium]|nr:sigma-70 family RNA polymerase sigma factor [Dehalococcoidia bacterium]